MIKKFYYNPQYKLTFDYGEPASYYNPTTVFECYEPYGEVINYPTIDDYISLYTISDLADYGILWDGKWYYDLLSINEVLTPYTVTSNDYFFANTVDQVLFGIRIKANSMSDVDIISLGSGVTHIELRDYVDGNGYYNVASIVNQTDANITCSDAGVEYMYIPSSITNLQNLFIRHNTCDCTIEYNGTSTQFYQIVGQNSIWNANNGWLQIVRCSDNVDLTYDFTNNQWIQI